MVASGTSTEVSGLGIIDNKKKVPRNDPVDLVQVDGVFGSWVPMKRIFYQLLYFFHE